MRCGPWWAGLASTLVCSQAQLLGVRGADQDVEGSSGSEEVGGPEIGPKDEVRDLSLGGVVAGLGSSVNNCGGRVVVVGGLAQGAASSVGSACAKDALRLHSHRRE